jgi:hypothetical protein
MSSNPGPETVRGTESNLPDKGINPGTGVEFFTQTALAVLTKEIHWQTSP